MKLHRLATLLTAALIAGAVPLVPAIAQQGPGVVEQDYDPAPALWVLKDEDTTIYMLGTIHVLPRGFRWRNPQLDSIIDEVDELVLESSDADADASLRHLAPKLAKLLADRTPTSEQLAPAARPKWQQLVEMTGQPFDYVDHTPLMYALMSFGIGGGNIGPSSYDHGVETELERIFKRTDRPIHSIEDTGRVMMSLYRIDDGLVLPDLERDLLQWDGYTAEAFFGEEPDVADASDWEMEHNWARGILEEAVSFGIDDAKLARAFHRVLMTNRNQRWSAWLDERLDSPGTILLAVGAAHFEGDDSVLYFLRERGLEAERINKPVE